MYSVYADRKNIENILRDFYTITGIRVAFVSHDMKFSVNVPKESSSFCNILKGDSLATARCIECDRYAFEEANRTRNLFVYQCHAGLREAVAPIFFAEKLLGYLMMGQTLNGKPDKNSWENALQRCKDFKIDYNELESAFYNLQSLDIDKIISASGIMEICAKYIHLSKLVNVRQPMLLEKIKNFIDNNLHNNITISDLSTSLNLSRSYLSHVIKASLNTSLTKYIIDRRLEKAKSLLEQTDLKISDIAVSTGFQDQNYFARIFKRHYGVSATEHRTKSKIEARQC